MIVRCLEKCVWVLEIIHCALMVFFLHSIKKAIILAWIGNILLAKYVFGEGSLYINVLLCVSFMTKSICILYITFWFVHFPLFYTQWPLKRIVVSSIEKATPSIQMSGNKNSINIGWGCNLQFVNFGLCGGLVRFFWQANNALDLLWRWFIFGLYKL